MARTGRPRYDDTQLLRRMALEKRRNPERPYKDIAEELVRPLAKGDYAVSVALRLLRKERKRRAELEDWAAAHPEG